MRERAILATPDFRDRRRDSPAASAAAELEELAKAAGLEVAENRLLPVRRPNASLLVGAGQAGEVADGVKLHRANVVVFGSDLSGSQQRNLEEIIPAKTIDRTQLILDIFAKRARSMEGKLQVELAQLKYLLPRLGGKGIALSRLGGGVGTRGPGEQKLEMDRRRIRERIVRLERELSRLQRQRLASIRKKKEKDQPLVALVGYTNAGKSSLFNALTRSEALVKNQLFSTLDTTTRQFALPDGRKALLADTVGFVENLPHHLVESFKATLEEAVSADLLLHVIDASRPDRARQVNAVDAVLAGLGIEEGKALRVYNKRDLMPGAGETFPDGVFVSAKTGAGLEALEREIAARAGDSPKKFRLFVPRQKLGMAGFLYREGKVLSRDDAEGGSRFTVLMTEQAIGRFEKSLRGGC